MTDYGAELLGLRAKKRVNQKALAERAGIFAATLVDIENSKIGIDEPTFRKLVDCLNEASPAAEADNPAA